jgi:hypothetical protein
MKAAVMQIMALGNKEKLILHHKTAKRTMQRNFSSQSSGNKRKADPTRNRKLLRDTELCRRNCRYNQTVTLKRIISFNKHKIGFIISSSTSCSDVYGCQSELFAL